MKAIKDDEEKVQGKMKIDNWKQAMMKMFCRVPLQRNESPSWKINFVSFLLSVQQSTFRSRICSYSEF